MADLPAEAALVVPEEADFVAEVLAVVAFLAVAVLLAAVLELAEVSDFLLPAFAVEPELADFLPVSSSVAFVTFRTTLLTTLDTASGTMLV